MSSFNEIKKTSDETRKKIELLSVHSLPNNPSERGMTPEQIKKRFYDPILSSAASALTEIDRVVSEVNVVISKADRLIAETAQMADEAKKTSEDAAGSAGEAAESAEAASTRATKALTAAEASAEEAESAKDEAEAAKNEAEAAKKAILNIEINTSTSEPGAPAAANAEIVDGKIVLNLTLPRGIQGTRGIQGERGEGFSIKKVYTSVEEMNNGFKSDGLPEGSFVLVRSKDESLEDYGKLYVKGEYEYIFEVDMSVSIKGDKGDPGYTPQFGVDYWTNEHQNAIAAIIKSLVGIEVKKQVGVIENGSY